MPIINVLRMLIASGLSVVGFVMLAGMFVSESASNYTNWAIAGGTLILSVAFALIVFDGKEEVETDLL